MDNFDNEKKNSGGSAPSGNKGNSKPHHKNNHHHHGKGRSGKPRRPEGETEQIKNSAPASEIAAERPAERTSQWHSGQHKHNRGNRGGKKHYSGSRGQRAEQESSSAHETEQPVRREKTEQVRERNRDIERKPAQTESMNEILDHEFGFLPSRSKSESDFLSLGKTDDSYLDQMPLDPTLDAVFADMVSEEKVSAEGPEIVGIRFEHGSKVYYFDPRDEKYSTGTYAVVETAQGIEYGEVVIANRNVPEDSIVSPLRPVIRSATEEDTAHYEDNKRRQDEAFKICLSKIADHGLDMKLVECQYTFDNTKLIFFFTSAGRVDFRALVKDLASVFRTRIELRQIGIRDEARMVGGFGVCGRKLCCAGFLPNFVQVSIKMAKEQGLSINAAKISGTCGRLMCCLRYEEEAYLREIALMPPPDSVVDTPDGRGVVIDIAPIAGTVKVKLSDKQDVAPKSYHMSTIKVISKAESKKFDDSDGE